MLINFLLSGCIVALVHMGLLLLWQESVNMQRAQEKYMEEFHERLKRVKEEFDKAKREGGEV